MNLSEGIQEYNNIFRENSDDFVAFQFYFE
jgi:hypothetical protein